MKPQERRNRLAALGYRLVRNYRCPIRGKVMPFATVPTQTGSTCVHASLDEVDRRISQAEQIREWQRIS